VAIFRDWEREIVGSWAKKGYFGVRLDTWFLGSTPKNDACVKVGKQHHFDQAEFGDIKYTEPLLNNLHIVEPTLLVLKLKNPGRRGH